MSTLLRKGLSQTRTFRLIIKIGEQIMTNKQFTQNLTDEDNRLFRCSDYKMSFYQVKNGYNYHILVQDNTDDDAVPSLPVRCEGEPNALPIIKDYPWSLDRCVGIIDLCRDKESIFVDSDDQIVEVEPFFRRIAPIGEGYPASEIVVGKNRKRVEVLRPLSHPTNEFKKLVGCDEIKQRLLEFKSLAEYNKACIRQTPHLPVLQIFLHSVFYGNPGTGKTTVCRLYGSLLKEAGLLSKGHVVVADRNTLACEYFGETEQIVAQLLEMSKGGILMFDEAYLLEGSHRDDPNKMVLPLLLPALADDKNKDFAVVICGYKNKLDQMIKQNPGLYSRFVNRFEFKDYIQDELVEIGIRYLKSVGHTFSLDGLACFREELALTMDSTSKTSWANARSVKNMIEHIYIKRAMRYVQDGKLDREVTAEDICSIPYERHRKIGF